MSRRLKYSLLEVKNNKGMFISVVSLSMIDDEANIRTFTGLPSNTIKLSEHSAA